MKNPHQNSSLNQKMAMYFDNLLDQKAQLDFFKTMENNPSLKSKFEQEKSVRNWIKRSVQKPITSTEDMISSIKSKINFL